MMAYKWYEGEFFDMILELIVYRRCDNSKVMILKYCAKNWLKYPRNCTDTILK